VIGVMLQSPEAAALVRPILTPECFYGLVHQKVYSIILDLLDAGATPGVPLVADRMIAKHNVGRREVTSSLDYMRGEGVGYILNAQHYAHIIAQHKQRRDLLILTGDAYRRAGDLQTDPAAVAAQLAERLSTIAAGARNPARDGAVLVDLADVVAEPVEWFWPGKVPSDMLTLVSGDAGLGKTLIVEDMVARNSVGATWPDLPNVPRAAPGRALILTAEDSLKKVVRPRLEAAGADLSHGRIVALDAIEDVVDDCTVRRGFDLTRDVPKLEGALDRMGGASVVVIDPVMCFLGKSDSNSASDVRNVMAYLEDLAERRHCAVIAITHMNKGTGKALFRVLGSVAFVAAARAAWAVAKDVDDETGKRRLLCPLKVNLAAEPTGLAYSIASEFLPGLGSQPKVVWEPTPLTDVDIERHVGGGQDEQDAGGQAIGEAMIFLRIALTDGPMLQTEIMELATAKGIKEKTLRRAKRRLNVDGRRVGTSTGPWEWFLAEEVEA
jgi:hypothetical protein